MHRPTVARLLRVVLACLLLLVAAGSSVRSTGVLESVELRASSVQQLESRAPSQQRAVPQVLAGRVPPLPKRSTHLVPDWASTSRLRNSAGLYLTHCVFLR